MKTTQNIPVSKKASNASCVSFVPQKASDKPVATERREFHMAVNFIKKFTQFIQIRKAKLFLCSLQFNCCICPTFSWNTSNLSLFTLKEIQAYNSMSIKLYKICLS